MKFLVVFTFAFIALNALQSRAQMDEGQAKDMFRNIAGECRVKEKATEDNIEEIISKKMPESAEGKCMFICLQMQFGVVSFI